MIEAWTITAAANAIMVAIYGWLALMMIRGLHRGRQWVTNPLATGTAAIFVTCTLGHAHHLFDALFAPGFSGYAARLMFSDPLLLTWDVFTAAVAIWYWTLRSRFAVVFGGATLCADMDKRQREALEIHDNVVQGLVRAKMALDLGHREMGMAAVDETVDASERILRKLRGSEGAAASP